MQSVRGRGKGSRSAAARRRASHDGGFVSRLLTFFGFQESRAEWLGDLRAHVEQGSMPMRPALLACAVFYAIIGIYGVILGGNYNSVGQAMAAARVNLAYASGFTLKHVEIDGAPRNRKSDILAAIDAEPGDPILGIDMFEARRRLEKLAWVKQATVQRLLPDTIKVTIEERKPFALWQIDRKIVVIDELGVVIAEELAEQHAALPLVVGFGANRAARDFIAAIDAYPSIRSRMRAGVRVADRRWNVRLLNDVDIRLPENKVPQALEEIAALDDAYGLLSREIAALDFRLADRITIRLSDEAALRRAAMLKEQEKLETKRKRRQDT